MKKIVMIIAALFLGLNIFAQSTQEGIKVKINAAAQQMQSMQCDFVQTKHLKMLNDNLVSSGKMYYQQANKLRWQYTSPYSYVFILNESKVLLKNDNHNNVINIEQNKLFKEIAAIMMNSVVGKCLSDTKSFETAIKDNNSEWVATLKPLKKEIKQMFTTIVIYFNKHTCMVSKVELYERNNDKTVIELKNLIINKPIDAKIFAVN